MNMEFGALSPLPSEQLPGIPSKFDDDAIAITRLYIRGLIYESEANRARKKLIKMIEVWIQKENKKRKEVLT
jgi:hypothetical protein